jgi:hypothetical protein
MSSQFSCVAVVAHPAKSINNDPANDGKNMFLINIEFIRRFKRPTYHIYAAPGDSFQSFLRNIQDSRSFWRRELAELHPYNRHIGTLSEKFWPFGGSGSFGFWLRFRSVTGRRGHAPSLRPRQNAKIPRC